MASAALCQPLLLPLLIFLLQLLFTYDGAIMTPPFTRHAII